MPNVTADLQIVVDARDETTRVLKGIESSIIRFVGAVSASLAALSVTLFPIAAAADFQKQLLDVAKTTGYTDDQVASLAASLQKLSTNVNIAATDLAKIAASGGQLGLGKDSVQDLAAFVDTTARFASVLNVTEEEAAAGLGKISNIFGVMAKDVERISSTLNQVSNTSTITGEELLDIIQRIGTAGGTLDLKKAAALAAFGKDLGLTSETVGTTLNKIFLDLQAKAADVARLIGVPVEEFAALVRTDGIAAYKLYIETLSRLDNVQRSIISEQITGGGRIAAFVTSSVNDAANGFALLNKELYNANKGWDTGTSSLDEQARVLSGLTAQLQILRNVFVNIATVVGTRALPYITDLVKKLQAFGQDPKVTDRLNSFVTGIGETVAQIVSFISKVTELSGAIVPLATVLKAFVAIKIISFFGSLVASLIATTKATYRTVAAWSALGTANQQVARDIAAQASVAQATAANKNQPPPNLSNLAKLAVAIDKVYSPIRANQAALRDSYEKTEQRINDLTARRAVIVSKLTQQAQALAAGQQSEARRVYNTAIAQGNTVAQAQAKRTAYNQQTRAEINRLSALALSTDAKYQAALTNRAAQLRGIASQELNMQRQASTVSAPLVAYRSVTAAAGAAASSLIAVGTRVLSIAGSIAAVIGLVTYFLGLFGLLDPVVKKIKSILGVQDEAEIKRRDAERARLEALEAEKKRVAEVGEAYRAMLKNRTDKPAGKNTSLLTDDIRQQVEEINKAKDSYADLVFKGAALASNTDFVAARWTIVNQELDDAKKKYDELLVKKATALPNVSLGKVSPVTQFDEEIKTTAANVERLTKTLDGLKAAEATYGKRSRENFEAQKEAAQAAMEAASGLAANYDEAGIVALQALEKVLLAEKELTAAKEKERASAAKLGDGTDATARQEYEVAAEKVHRLTGELSLLSTQYDSVLESSTAATIFIAKSLPGETAKSLDSVRTILGAFSGVSGVVGEQVAEAAKKNQEAIDEVDKAIADLENKRKGKLLYQPVGTGSLTDDNARAERAKKINAEFDAARVPLLKTRRDLEAVYQQETLVQKAAAVVKGEYDRLSEAQKKRLGDSGRVAVAEIAAASANKIFTSSLLKAQERVSEGAKFNSARVRKLFEGSLTDLAAIVDKMKNMLLGLGNYFASRRIAVKLANFDLRNKKDDESFARFQEMVLDSERERLAASGLTTEQQAEQLKIMQEMLTVEQERRGQRQEAERQQIVLNDAQQRMVQAEKEANEYTTRGIELARQAEAARAAGNVNAQISLGRQAEEEAAKAKIAIEDMSDAYNTFKEEARKPVVNAGAAFLAVSDDQVRKITDTYAKAEVAVAQGQANILKLASTSAEAEATKQSAILEGLTKEVAAYQKQLDTLLSSATGKGLKSVSEALGQIAIANTPGQTQFLADLKSIAESDFSGLTKFDTLVSDSVKIGEVRNAFKEVATAYAQTIVPAGATAAATSQAVLQDVSEIGKLTEGVRRMQQALNLNPGLATNLDFEESLGKLQEQLRDRKFVVNLEFAAGAPSARKNAAGGHIRGPGTGTSDSILSWLSNGEYVSDAQTTSFFGPGFFAALKSMARSGSSSAFKMMGGLRLPAFAGGGPVLPGSLGLGGGLAGAMASGNGPIIDRVAVDLNVASESVSLFGERAQVNKLLQALHRVNKG